MHVRAMTAFEMFDVDQTGTIDFDEFLLIMHELSTGHARLLPYDGNGRSVFDQIDRDGDGVINSTEFGEWSVMVLLCVCDMQWFVPRLGTGG